jgi:L-alanine-DL-glutamate epimerase-like enolase superfamily enzyme
LGGFLFARLKSVKTRPRKKSSFINVPEKNLHFLKSERPSARSVSVPIEKLTVETFHVPTHTPKESDGTLTWDHTTIVIVHAEADGNSGIGYTFADDGSAKLIEKTLKKNVERENAMDVGAIWQAMIRHIRNLGRPGICSMAISAVDLALWDLKARLLGVPLTVLLGHMRETVPIYGSGGFTNYSIPELQAQLAGWVEQGVPRVKMKIGTHPDEDLGRVRAAREAIGDAAELFVDANGAYTPKQAIEFASRFVELGVKWFEEPVSSDDLRRLRFIREHAPAEIEIAAGEYGYDNFYFLRMLEAQAVDVLQADATRCGGITGFLQAAILCDAFQTPLSGHTAPAIHMHVCCAAPRLRHLEYFYDHVRIERMFFDGIPQPENGVLRPDLSRPGNGLEFKRKDAARYAA